jgi:hypothetical protein
VVSHLSGFGTRHTLGDDLVAAGDEGGVVHEVLLERYVSGWRQGVKAHRVDGKNIFAKERIEVGVEKAACKCRFVCGADGHQARGADDGRGSDGTEEGAAGDHLGVVPQLSEGVKC